MAIEVETIRAQFPSLKRSAIFFDNPGGTQVARQCLDRIQNYLQESNANHGGAFETSRKSDEILAKAHAAMADFLNASRDEEIVFGPNMTTLTLGLSRALARRLDPDDEIVVTRLDHDANIAPWLLIAEDRGCKIRWVDFDVEECTLDLESFQKALEHKPKIVAFGYASNAVGTINPVRDLVKLAHEAGALTYVDAVQYAPHGPIDVQDLDTDFLVCSAYKFFGPHVGVLYGKYSLLDSLKAYKVRPAPDEPPGKFETGTQNHEGIAGVLGAVEYLEWLGDKFGQGIENELSKKRYQGHRLNLKKAMTVIRAYELELSQALIHAIENIRGSHIYGITDTRRLKERVPTVSFRLGEKRPREIAELLDQSGIYVWDGNYYALAVTERLGIEDAGGMVRVGGAHYNTLDEVFRLGVALQKIAE